KQSVFYKMNGGRRPGAGRKKGGRNAAQLKIIDIAGQVLQEIDAKEKWKALLNCSHPKVILDVMKYLTDRVHGRPTQTAAAKIERRILNGPARASRAGVSVPLAPIFQNLCSTDQGPVATVGSLKNYLALPPNAGICFSAQSQASR